MIKNDTSCIKISDTGICPNCKSKNLVKNGFTKNKKQQYYCKTCCKRSIDYYCNQSYIITDKSIIQLTKEGLGIRSSARVLQISTTTLLKRIIKIAKAIKKPITKYRMTYEVDEMRIYLRRKDKPIWIVYALERASKSVVSFAVGRRTKQTLQYVTNHLQLSLPNRIYTDRLIHYKSLLDTTIHSVKRFGTNHIERNNLSMRTHLKRLSRKTICFSRSFIALQCVLKIYFWG